MWFSKTFPCIIYKFGIFKRIFTHYKIENFSCLARPIELSNTWEVALCIQCTSSAVLEVCFSTELCGKHGRKNFRLRHFS